MPHNKILPYQTIQTCHCAVCPANVRPHLLSSCRMIAYYSSLENMRNKITSHYDSGIVCGVLAAIGDRLRIAHVPALIVTAVFNMVDSSCKRNAVFKDLA